MVRYFGIEQGGNTSKDAAIAIDHSLKFFDYYLLDKVKFSSSMMDADGGGVGLSLVTKLNDVGCSKNMLGYIWGTCVLHAMNLMFSAQVETLMGVGGLKKRTLLQMLYTAYFLKNLYQTKRWKEMWVLATGTF